MIKASLDKKPVVFSSNPSVTNALSVDEPISEMQLLQIKDQITAPVYGKTIINLVGKSGSGKGTQCVYLSAKIGLPHISIGDLFRSEARNQTVLNDLIEVHDVNHPPMELPDEIWFGILIDRLSQPDCAKGYILDNFPRNAAQAKILLQGLMRPEDRHIPIYLDLSEEIIKQRLRSRYICPICGNQVRGHDGNNSGVCGNATCKGQQLEHRVEDRDEIKMNEKFAIFRKNIGPILGALEARDTVNYIKLNGDESPQNISKVVDRIVFERLTVDQSKALSLSQ